MTIEEFVAELKLTPPEEQTPGWVFAQQDRAASYGLDWQAVCEVMAAQQKDAEP